MHRLDDKTLITPMLLRRFQAEGEFEGADGRFAAFVQRSDGSYLKHTLSCQPGMLERLFAEDMLSALNDELAHDGAWTIVFTHYDPPKPPMAEGVFNRFVLLWMDKDGDVKFPIECAEPLHKHLPDASIHGWLTQCEAAYVLWQRTERVLDLKDGEQYRKAAGEKAPSVH